MGLFRESSDLAVFEGYFWYRGAMGLVFFRDLWLLYSVIDRPESQRGTVQSRTLYDGPGESNLSPFSSRISTRSPNLFNRAGNRGI